MKKRNEWQDWSHVFMVHLQLIVPLSKQDLADGNYKWDKPGMFVFVLHRKFQQRHSLLKSVSYDVTFPSPSPITSREKKSSELPKAMLDVYVQETLCNSRKLPQWTLGWGIGNECDRKCPRKSCISLLQSLWEHWEQGCWSFSLSLRALLIPEVLNIQQYCSSYYNFTAWIIILFGWSSFLISVYPD